MTDFTHHIPRLLSDADAAADLAGVPRPNDLPSVGTPEPRWFDTYQGPQQGYTVKDTLALVSERDELASRVRELEGREPAGWYSKQYGFVYMKRQPHMFEVGSILYLKDGRPAWRVDSKCSMTALMGMSDLPHGEVFYLNAPERSHELPI
jgi:hypothetical protein